jgi:tetratricopeptide (TPR) repeat protein
VLADLVVLAAAVMLGYALRAGSGAAAPVLAPRRISPAVSTAVAYADRLFAEKRWLAAEKAYVNVLKLDHKNLTAYSHLGIIYSTQKNFADAIECFQIVVRLKPSAGSHQNLAMAYYENRNFVKSISAYDKAIMFEPTAARYVGQSKAYKKISNLTAVVTNLELAAKLDSSSRIKDLLAAAYVDVGRPEAAKALHEQTPAQSPGPSAGSASPQP